MTKDQQNFIWTIVLSLLIIIGWEYFYMQPRLQNKGGPSSTITPLPPKEGEPVFSPTQGIPPSQPSSAENSEKESLRIPIQTQSLRGSLSLRGGMINDLSLIKYRETVSSKSPEIRLLSPPGTEKPYFVEQGFLAPSGSSVEMPGPQTVWQAPPGAVLTEKTPITLTWQNKQGVFFSKKITVDDNAMFTVQQTVENHSTSPVSFFPYARIERRGTPQVAGIYVIHEGFLGVLNGQLEEVTYKNLAKEGKPLSYTSTGGWLGITDKYWAVTLIPPQDIPFSATFQHTSSEPLEKWQTDYVTRSPIVVPPHQTKTLSSHFFAGAKVVEAVTRYGHDLSIDRFDLLIDWGWFYFITKPMFRLLHFIQLGTGNFGIAILIVTVLLKILFFPLANRSYKSMSKMKKLQPEIERLKVRFGDDRVKLQEAMMELYKKEKINPVSGCLPMLVQIPVFFSLYKVIYVTIEMRHAPFYGWIKDLSAPDPTSFLNLFGLLPWHTPLVLTIGVLPLLMGLTMWVQMRLNPTPTDPIQATVFNWMPVIFTVMLAPFPAGLVLYWAWNNLLSILQQAIMMKREGVEIKLFSFLSILGKKQAPKAQNETRGA